MTSKEKEARSQEFSLYPVHPLVLKETEEQIFKDFDGVFNTEFEELMQAQPTIISILSRYNLIDPEFDPKGTEAVFQGASFAYRLFKNQAKLQNKHIPIIPKEIEEAVSQKYEEYKRETNDKNNQFRADIVFDHKIKISQEALFKTLLKLSTKEPRDSLTYKRLQGAVITTFIFKTYQEVAELKYLFSLT